MKRFGALLILSLGLLVGTSCLKAPPLDTDHGPAVEPSEVQQAILEAWGDADFNSIRQGDFLYIEQDQKVSSLEPRVVYKEASDVKSRTVNEAQGTITYLFEVQTQAMENGSFKPITVIEDPLTVPITPPSSMETPSPSPTQKAAFPDSLESFQKSMAEGRVGLYSSGPRNHYLGVFTIQTMLLACVKDKDWDVSCHNLQVTEGTRPPPMGVASQPQCGGIPGCLIRYKKISFDLVVNLKNADTGEVKAEKANYELVISPDVPYLSRLLEFCNQLMVPTQNQKVLVKLCNKVQNFKVGTVP